MPVGLKLKKPDKQGKGVERRKIILTASEQSDEFNKKFSEVKAELFFLLG